MNIFRTSISDKYGFTYLVDAEHVNKKMGVLKIFPVLGGVIQPMIPLCHFENVKDLIEKLEGLIAQS